MLLKLIKIVKNIKLADDRWNWLLLVVAITLS